MSLAPNVFKALARARADGVPMTPRSAGDKEYFAQDWFADRLTEVGVPFEAQGRNSYPDFLVGPDGGREGFEIKSLAFNNGKPARKDLDFNSTIPSGRKDAMDVFLVFFLYEGRGAQDRSVHTIAVAHGDLINADHDVADQHVNVKVPRFGSFGDGFIRNRKMYVFPHPATIDPSGLGEARLIVPASWDVQDGELEKVGSISRVVAPDAIDSYRIHLYGGQAPTVTRDPYPDAGQARQFDVFRMVL